MSRRDTVMALAREHMLTAYDATYLDLALRKDAALATFDTELLDAMYRAGGKVFNNSQG
jgi:predicted nucleic acid-binding protein